jgi:hypothetical protein
MKYISNYKSFNEGTLSKVLGGAAMLAAGLGSGHDVLSQTKTKIPTKHVKKMPSEEERNRLDSLKQAKEDSIDDIRWHQEYDTKHREDSMRYSAALGEVINGKPLKTIFIETLNYVLKDIKNTPNPKSNVKYLPITGRDDKLIDSSKREVVTLSTNNITFKVSPGANSFEFKYMQGDKEISATVSDKGNSYYCYYEEPHIRGFNGEHHSFYSDKDIKMLLDKITIYLKQNAKFNLAK